MRHLKNKGNNETMCIWQWHGWGKKYPLVKKKKTVILYHKTHEMYVVDELLETEYSKIRKASVKENPYIRNAVQIAVATRRQKEDIWDTFSATAMAKNKKNRAKLSALMSTRS